MKNIAKWCVVCSLCVLVVACGGMGDRRTTMKNAETFYQGYIPKYVRGDDGRYYPVDKDGRFYPMPLEYRDEVAVLYPRSVVPGTQIAKVPPAGQRVPIQQLPTQPGVPQVVGRKQQFIPRFVDNDSGYFLSPSGEPPVVSPQKRIPIPQPGFDGDDQYVPVRRATGPEQPTVPPVARPQPSVPSIDQFYSGLTGDEDELYTAPSGAVARDEDIYSNIYDY